MKIAFATNDGIELVKDHFGEAEFFYVYDVSKSGWRLLKKIENKSKEERFHGDPEKAKSIASLLVGTDVLVGFQMGPNIQRMKNKFLTVISRYEKIEENLEIIKQNFEEFDRLCKEKGKIVIINPGPKIVKV